MNRILFAFLFLFTLNAWGADANGYTAQYECRSGGPNCDVDVVTLVAQSCQQTVLPNSEGDTTWTKITSNPSSNVFCIKAGDHTAKGVLTLPSDGTSGTRKILKYWRATDNNDEPWNQGSNQAKIYGIDTNGKDYWIIHRITVDRNYTGNGTLVALWSDTTNLIMNRILVQHGAESGWLIATHNSGQQDIVLQNSVIRRATLSPAYPIENQCVGVGNTLRFWAVNNEIYDCNKAITASDGDSFIGGVVENNDLYQSPAGQTDCNGNLDTAPRNCGTMEGMAVFKGGASSGTSNIGRIVHNRIWGGRVGDSTIALPGSNVAVSLSSSPSGGTGADYMLVQNNIIFDGHVGVWNYHGLNPSFPGVIDGPNNVSVIGNILYNMVTRYPVEDDKGAFNVWRTQEFEWYLNTIIDAQDTWMRFSSGSGESNANHDVKCNVAIASAAADTSGAGSGFVMDTNVFYGTTTSGTNTISKSLNTLSGSFCTTLGCTSTANTTGRTVGDIVRTSSDPKTTCTGVVDTDCFLYQVQSPISASGSIKAIRGPYSFRRKLKTVSGGEVVIIPYAIPHTSAPEASFCPSQGDASPTGSRTGIGIDNTILGSGGFMDTGIKGARTN